MPDKAPDGFLGGGPRFNTVGNHPSQAEEAPIVHKNGLQPHQIRKIVAGIAVVVLIVAVYMVADSQNGNMHHPAKQHAGDGTSIEKPTLDVDHP